MGGQQPEPNEAAPAAAAAAPTPAAAAAAAAALRGARRKLFWRVLAPAWACVFVNFLDKGNLAYGSLQMTRQLGFSPSLYGLGAGLLFVGYAAAMVPANAALPLLGAPRWLAVLCVAWGAVATAGAAVNSAAAFLAVRTLLGVTEAGVVPAILFLLTSHFHQSRLTLPYTAVVLGQTLAQVAGAPLAAAIQLLDGAGGLAGWRWLFLLEGIPALLLAPVMWRLPASVSEAAWLSAEERAAACALLEMPEAAGGPPAKQSGAGRVGGSSSGDGTGGGGSEGGGAAREAGPVRDGKTAAAGDAAAPSQRRSRCGCGGGGGGGVGLNGRCATPRDLARVLALPVVICGSAWSLLFGMATQAFNYFTPMVVASMQDGGLAGPAGAARTPRADRTAVLLSAVPFAAAAAAQAAVAWSSQRSGERRLHTAAAFGVSAASLLLLPLPLARGAPGAAFAVLVVAAAAAFAGTGPNLSWKNAMLAPEDRLLAMPVMVAVTSLGGFAGPFAVGSLRTSSGDFNSGFYLLGACMLAAAAMVAAFPPGWAARGSEERARGEARGAARRAARRRAREAAAAGGVLWV
ncbi:hypothetical protein Rsub_10868 [Raphidocelis subcapitata]|uniref:Major facilitator superfamily (MFS) profile domain-containing protein n=1 Tax=Raphidocelis subcapitata TaxID=307507 RepID=A0A2V0PE41_9CHLO|nr:hypothetical protein Rsub_10868 [Raphidocelis subcapitata]|eukprot:GBF98121.1 hypothetical protein Rsub_10868 [Raphidocelis subcapitata]